MLYGKKIVSVCLSAIHEEINIEFISKLNASLTRQDYRLMIYNIGADLNWDVKNEDSEILVLDLLDYRITDVIVILDEQIKDRKLVSSIIDRAKAGDIPVIIIDGHYDGCVNIEFDYKRGFELIVRHVMEKHSPATVHYMAGFRDNHFSEERKAVFARVIQDYGLSFDESMVSYGDFWAIPTIRATQKLIDENRLPEAIICANDIMAINVVSLLKEKGYRVPEDIIVTGFDGIEEIQITEPRITSVRCEHGKLAEYAIESILKGERQCDHKVVPQLLVSESCGCEYKGHLNIIENPEMINGRFYKYQEDNRILMKMCENIQNSSSMKDGAKAMRNRVMKHTCVMLNKWCFDASVNPLNECSGGIEEDVSIFFESRDWQPQGIYDFKRKEFLPGLEILLERPYPIIFSELDYMNVPLGYVCFFYKSCDIIYYKKIPQIVSAINNGIGGLLNRRYQEYLKEQVEYIYEQDALTGLYNRLGFGKRLEKMIENPECDELTVVLSDLDGLKYINDNYGHIAGDVAIRMVAQALKDTFPRNALCVRFGGDEMLAVVQGRHVEKEIRGKFREILDEYNKQHEMPFEISSSLGILQVKQKDIDDFDTIFKIVDELMYKDKTKKSAKTIQISFKNK